VSGKLGDKIKKWIITLEDKIDCINPVAQSFRISAMEELNQLLEYKEKYEEKCQELEADHSASEEAMHELTLEYNELDKELGEVIEAGKIAMSGYLSLKGDYDSRVVLIKELIQEKVELMNEVDELKEVQITVRERRQLMKCCTYIKTCIHKGTYKSFLVCNSKDECKYKKGSTDEIQFKS